MNEDLYDLDTLYLGDGVAYEDDYLDEMFRDELMDDYDRLVPDWYEFWPDEEGTDD